MRKSSVFLLSLFIASSLCFSVSADAGDVPSLETDPDVFAMITGVAHWDVPDGYQMEGFLRTDINGDDITDAIVLLGNTADAARRIAVIVSGPDGYQVTEKDVSIPLDEIGKISETGALSMDAFAGLNAEIDCIALYARFFASPEAAHDLPNVSPGSIVQSVPIGREAPEATPAPAGDAKEKAADGIFCNACKQYFQTGEAFRNHDCIAAPREGEPSHCAVCGKNFDSPEALLSHTCVQTENLECAICHQLFSDAESYQNHICISYLDGNSVYCDICGGWYAEGEAFRSHLCVPR